MKVLMGMRMTDSTTMRGTRLRRTRIGMPLKYRHAISTSPATVQRVPENRPGGTIITPTFIASQLVPQTKHRKANSNRCWVNLERGIRPGGGAGTPP